MGWPNYAWAFNDSQPLHSRIDAFSFSLMIKNVKGSRDKRFCVNFVKTHIIYVKGKKIQFEQVLIMGASYGFFFLIQ